MTAEAPSSRPLRAAAGRIAVWPGRAAIRLLRLVPPARLARFAAALGGAIGPLLPRNRVALDNLRQAFPEKGEDECRAIRRDMWRHLFRVIAEGLQADRVFDFNAEGTGGSNVIVVGAEQAKRLRDDGRPGLIFSAHLGNWELLPVAGAHIGLEITSLYRPPNAAFAADIVERVRARGNSSLVASGAGAAFKLAAVLEQGGHVGLLVDQKFTNHSKVRIDFFGRPANANPLIAKLARRFDCPVHGARVIRTAGDKLKVELTGPLDLPRDASGQIDVARATAMVNAIVEDWVRETPEQWLWIHRRWAL